MEGQTQINSDEPLWLHHGTTLQAASQIVQSGWQTLNVQGIIERAALTFNVERTDIYDLLARNGRFVVIVDDRGTNASFSADLAKVALSWAQRAPEAEWEALWAVYHLLHPESEPELNGWTAAVAGRAWVWNQMRVEPLAILSYQTSVAELHSIGARYGTSRLPLDVRHGNLLTSSSEISIDLPFHPDSRRTRITQIPRLLTADIYAHELGLSPEEFERLAEGGDLGEPTSARLPFEPPPTVPKVWWDSATAPMIKPPRS